MQRTTACREQPENICYPGRSLGADLGYGQARKKTQIQQIIFTHGYRNTQKNWLTQQITFFGIQNFPRRSRYSSAVFLDYLERKGFVITKGISRLQTAFVAEWGTGKPILGFLAEYDALPGLGQEPVCTYQPLKTPGHGCGHNLLGTACAGAACALKGRMEKRSFPEQSGYMAVRQKKSSSERSR